MFGLGSFVANLINSETLKKRILRYLLKRYVGQFLLEKLSLDQFTIDIISGTGIIQNLALDVGALNETAEQLNLPIKFVHGFIGEISLTIPWKALFKSRCFVEISGLTLTIEPKHRLEDISLVDSMLDSMSSSMQIAHECLSQVEVNEEELGNLSRPNSNSDYKNDESTGLDGLELFAKAIDSVLKRIKVQFKDNTIRLEHAFSNSLNGIALQISVDIINYFDKAGEDNTSTEDTIDNMTRSTKNINEEINEVKNKSGLDSFNGFTAKEFLINGIHIYTDEYNCNIVNLENGANKLLEKALQSGILDENINTSIDFSNLKEMNGSCRSVTNNTEPILVAKIIGTQQLIVKLRDHENSNGCKVGIIANIEDFVGFFSPRQLYLLMEFLDAYTAACEKHKIENKKNPVQINSNTQKPMNFNDFRSVEHEVQKNIQNHILNDYVGSNSLNNVGSWSKNPLVTDREFRPMNNANDLMEIRGPNINKNEENKDECLFSIDIEIHSCSVCILQEDLLVPSDDINEVITAASLADMHMKAKDFFSCIGNLSHSKDNFHEEFDKLKSSLDSCCSLSHIRVITTPIKIESSEKSKDKVWERTLHISFGWSEIREILFDCSNKISSQLLSFPFNDEKLLQKNSNINIVITESATISEKRDVYSDPKIDVSINLDDFCIDFDMTMIDRVQYLLEKQVIVKSANRFDIVGGVSGKNSYPKHPDNKFSFNQLIEDIEEIGDKKVTMKLHSNSLSTKLYFPIPDLRPLSDFERMPWWKRNVREESLLLTCTDFNAKAFIKTETTKDTFVVGCNEMNIAFQQNDKCLPLPLIKISNPEKVKTKPNTENLESEIEETKPSESKLNQIQISLEMYSRQLLSDLATNENVSDNLMQKSTMDCIVEIDKEPSIFTQRKLVTKQNVNNLLTLPSSKSELNRFMEYSTENSKMKLDIILPQVQFVLPSKHVLEILYNRVLSDLLLWAPATIVNKSSDSLPGKRKREFKPFGRNITPEENFMAENTSSSDTDQKSEKQNEKQEQSYLAATISIGKVIGQVLSPYRNEDGEINIHRQGNFVIELSNIITFAVVGFQGDSDRCLTFITSKKTTMYHANVKSVMSPILPKFDSSYTKFKKILFPSRSVVSMKGNASIEDDNLVICINSGFDTPKNEKYLQLAGGLKFVTLNHYVTKSNEDWITQLQDTFVVEDFPINGYCLPSVVTELNFQFVCCSIEYLPLNLPLRARIVSDSTFISSNMNLEEDVLVLLILIEDSGLFIAQEIKEVGIDRIDPYVCLMHLGVMEICSRTDSIRSELTLSNDMLQIYTCSDTFKALLELLIYITNEGDLIQETKFNRTGEISKDIMGIIKPSEMREAIYSQSLNTSREMSEHSIVEVLMEEAMKDSSPIKNVDDNIVKKEANGVKVFLFPGEDKKSNTTPCYTMEDSDVMVTSYVDDPSAFLNEAIDGLESEDEAKPSSFKNDNEYCIIDRLSGAGILPNCEMEPISGTFVGEVDGDSNGDPFFIKKEDSEITDEQSHSTEKVKNSIQDVSITWNMYGGNDFRYTNAKNNPKTKKSGSRVSLSHAVSFNDKEGVCVISADQSNRPIQSSVPSNNKTKWYISGGCNRNHDVLMQLQLNKIQFTYIDYIDESMLQCKHELIIGDIEIRDRLTSSLINKFLYQYYTEDFPREIEAKSNTGMVHIVASTVKDNPYAQSQEVALNISMKPLRLHVDQDSLTFLINFFNNITSINFDSKTGVEQKPICDKSRPIPRFDVPVMSLNKLSDKEENLINFLEDEKYDSSQPLYFKSFSFAPEIPIKVDYHGKYIDMRSQYGPLAGLIIGLGQLDNSEITLKSIKFSNGVLGIDKLIGAVVEEWINDIKQHQLPSIIGGVGPLHSFVRLANGVRDLFWMPIEQYQKDGRVLRGIQKGTSSFTYSSAYAALDLGGKFASYIQSAAELTFDIVSPVHRTSHKKNVQPQDIREGFTSAVKLLKHGIGDAAYAIRKVAAEEHSHKGMSGAVGGIIRQIPPSIVEPFILASEATCTVIGGLKNQLVPDAHKEAAEKWKS